MFRTFARPTAATLAAAVLAIAGSSLPAAARTTVAFAGRAQAPADAGCFSEWYGTMTNNCAGTKLLIIPLTVDPAGNHSVTVTAYGATSANNVGCAALGINKETTGYTGGVTYYLPSFGASADITTSAYVPGSGSLFVACYVNQGGRVNVVNTTW